jgi:hypothetical protein
MHLPRRTKRTPEQKWHRGDPYAPGFEKNYSMRKGRDMGIKEYGNNQTSHRMLKNYFYIILNEVKDFSFIWKYKILRGVYPEAPKARFFATLRMTAEGSE